MYEKRFGRRKIVLVEETVENQNYFRKQNSRIFVNSSVRNIANTQKFNNLIICILTQINYN